MSSAGFAAGVTLLLTLVLMPGVIMLLRQIEALDHPNERSSHSRPTLRGGGVGPLLAISAVLLTIGLVATEVSIGLVFATAAFGLLGLLEDLRGVPAVHRFAAQVVVAAATVMLLGLFGAPWLWMLPLAALAAFWIVAYVNAFNFMDGINGISSLQALVGGVGLATMALRIDDTNLALYAAVVAAASLGFLPFNFPRARVFLGDTGSYVLGAYLAVLVVLALQAGLPPAAALAPVLLYVADTGVTLARRILRGAQWHKAHREHVYQRLTRLGWSHTQVSLLVAVLIGAQTALGYATIAATTGVQAVAVVGLALLTLAYLCTPGIVARHEQPARVSS